MKKICFKNVPLQQNFSLTKINEGGEIITKNVFIYIDIFVNH